MFLTHLEQIRHQNTSVPFSFKENKTWMVTENHQENQHFICSASLIYMNYFSLVSSQANKHLKGNKHSTNEIFSLTNCLGVVPEKYVLFGPPLVTTSYLLIPNRKNQKGSKHHMALVTPETVWLKSDT